MKIFCGSLAVGWMINITFCLPSFSDKSFRVAAGGFSVREAEGPKLLGVATDEEAAGATSFGVLLTAIIWLVLGRVGVIGVDK